MPAPSTPLLVSHALAVGLGAFLLFLVQPLMGAFLLPWFGGGSGVWAVCLVFFQALLFAGYAYAHVLARWSLRTQSVVHVVLLAAALLALPIVPGAAEVPTAGGDPVRGVLALLARHVGLPYLALASTAPLLQHWYGQRQAQASPYWLYALSNAASLLALLGYPFLFEPVLGRASLARLWTWSFGAFVLTCAFCALGPAARVAKAVRVGVGPHGSPELRAGRAPLPWGLWLLLPACSSSLLVATTNAISLDVAPMPLLWVLPLAAFLATYVLTFSVRSPYRRGPCLAVAGLAWAGVAWLRLEGVAVSFLGQTALYVTALGSACLVCHGELYRLRPRTERLTAFYLLQALGGALGGLAVAIVAPLAFERLLELPLALALFGALVVVGTRPRPARAALGAASAGLVLALLWADQRARAGAVRVERNFYGTQSVVERDAERPLWHALLLKNGSTTHGLQYQAPELRAKPTLYFTPESGVGLAIRSFPPDRPLGMGVVGLGAGTLAAYGKPGDRIEFYEIDPKVRAVAREAFSFLADSPAEVRVLAGDARLSLEQRAPQGYDLVVLDAFSGDAVPVHLLTLEAFEAYARHLAPGGLVAAHLSNRYLDLLQVVAANARALGWSGRWVQREADPARRIELSTWAVLSPDPAALARARLMAETEPLPEATGRPWTDGHAPLASALR